MQKYELSLSTNYAQDWTVVDGVREIFQNALDQETMSPDNKMFHDYDKHTQTLLVGNAQSILETGTLLLGASTKSEDNSTIGKFGEGYKIGILVLLRAGKNVIIYNYGKREVWMPRLVKSRRYNAEVLTFFVDKRHLWDVVPNNNLTVEILGITPDEYESIKDSNLHLQGIDPTTVVETSLGKVLLSSTKYAGKIFVNGLFICMHEPYKYGYDFKPEHITLDRDRKFVSDFALQWLSS